MDNEQGHERRGDTRDAEKKIEGQKPGGKNRVWKWRDEDLSLARKEGRAAADCEYKGEHWGEGKEREGTGAGKWIRKGRKHKMIILGEGKKKTSLEMKEQHVERNVATETQGEDERG